MANQAAEQESRARKSKACWIWAGVRDGDQVRVLEKTERGKTMVYVQINTTPKKQVYRPPIKLVLLESL